MGTVRVDPSLMSRSRSPGERLQQVVMQLPRSVAVRPAHAVARVVLDYVLDDRSHVEHAVDVVAWWSAGQADEEGLAAVRETIRAVASRANDRDERGAWLAVQAAAALLDVALEPWWELAGKRARDLAGCVLEAVCWPDVDDPAVAEAMTEALHDRIDEALQRVR